ncbi:MAG: DEAD/DEAH box helicase family protein [Bacteroidales bacterium]|nr:DEAD/DEAH box helicase family protein [Bacteroidales bacterium]
MSNFITNSPTKDLKKRISEIIKVSKELKFLVGFFYFSGIQELIDALKDNPSVELKVLVGLNVDRYNNRLFEYADDQSLSDDEKTELFFQSIKRAVNTEEFDTKQFYEQIGFFLKLITENRITIRKTLEPNHAKLYLFKLDDNQRIREKLFITGSSNLTRAGLTTQNEFNVEISDYGFEEADKYFDTLWENSIKITEWEDVKLRLIEIIEKETHVKQVTPFEAYLLVLKSYLEAYEHKDIGTYLPQFLEKIGYKPYRYQLDAVQLGLSIIEQHNGVLIADVVGLGKTIIACTIAKALRKRGMVICPPGLIGDENKNEGWRKYLDQFQLYDWEVRSQGKLEETFEYIKDRDDFEVIIVDEAHRFRNPDTQSYEYLKNICRGKIVILLTATPFNNKPSDILALLNLFIIPRKSSITLDYDLISLFRSFGYLFDMLSFIKKNHSSRDTSKQKKAQTYYKNIFDDDTIQITRVARKTHLLAKQIRDIIEPITIRRNRLDLTKNPNYQSEVKELSVVNDPIEWFFELTPEQSIFYDEIINHYFADPDEGGLFSGAIYRPFEYEGGISSDSKDRELNRELLQQRNLFDIMRRLVVKRFESSFGSFEKTIQNFKRINTTVLDFITKTGNGDPLNGEYILDRDLLEDILGLEMDEIEERLVEYEQKIRQGVYPKKHKRYKIGSFRAKSKFIQDIQSDLVLFDEIIKRLEEFNLLHNDPKATCLISNLEGEFAKPINGKEPKRKYIIFSEYADTVDYLYNHFEKLKPELAKRTLVVKGNITQAKYDVIIRNFDAANKNQLNEYDILLCTDKLSEGFNLNRAGMIINYDIPWNPVRVIQRLGRINRISKKVFEHLYIVNFFPTEQGAELVKSREIAQNKMFMIHNTLGEDAKIFDIDEEPTPAKLYQKIMQNPDTAEEESFYTKVLNLFNENKAKYPDIIDKLKNAPPRIKVAKPSNENNIIVCFKKNRMYIRMSDMDSNPKSVFDTSLEFVLDNITCTPDTQPLPLDNDFWDYYQRVKTFKAKAELAPSEQSIEKIALNNLNYWLRLQEPALLPYKPFIRTLREDILDYGTLSQFTLRRIANLKNNGNGLTDVISEISKLINELGENYLEREKNRMSKAETDIIIAIRNTYSQPN